MSKTVKDLVVVSKDAPSSNKTTEQTALFNPDGTPFLPLTEGSNVIEHQAVFAGADLTALKVELNAFRTKLLASGLMAAS